MGKAATVLPSSNVGSANSSASPAASSDRRRFFALPCWGKSRKFAFRSDTTLFDEIMEGITWLVEKFVLILGPLLIIFASLIIGGMSWTFFTIILPMIQDKHADDPPLLQWSIILGHVGMVLFLLTEICFNYFYCVTTSNVGPKYDRVVRELAAATNLEYPETPQQVDSFRRDFEAKMMIRMRRRQQKTESTTTKAAATKSSPSKTNKQNKAAPSKTPLSSTSSSSSRDLEAASPTSDVGGVKQRKKAKPAAIVAKMGPLPTAPSVRSWMLLGPDEWGYCQRSNQPKPPRSHYDHVSRSLVLCLDHYCPWMFNAIGYFNYRYFCNFLWFVELGMIYGVIVTFEAFMNTTGTLYKHQVQEYRKTGEWVRIYPMVPFSRERLPVSMCFMLCLAVGVAVACLGGFHLYLCLTAQTTIEFHGNFANRRKASKLNKKWKNPYDMGWKRNFQQVYGQSLPAWKAILIPSTREPEFLPLPMPGDEGLRQRYKTPHSTTASTATSTTAAAAAETIV